MSNAMDFIAAYNRVDARMRAMCGGKVHNQFSDLVRRCAQFNATIKKYEDQLISFAKLRNSIVHESTREYVIAEPCDDVTRLFCHIADLLCSPPLLSTLKQKKVTGVDSETTLAEALIRSADCGYSNLPVYRGRRVIGMLNDRRLVRVIGRALQDGVDVESALSVPCGQAIRDEDMLKYYKILGANSAIQDAVDAFEENRRLHAVIVTDNGTLAGEIVNLITSSDLPYLYKLLEE